jgi:omega-amidase
VQVVLVQLDIAWEDPAKNYAKVRELLRASPPRAGAMVILPEMFATGFSMNVATVAEREPRPTERSLAELAREHGVYVMGGLASRIDERCVRNECVVFDAAGSIVARYGKLHPFTLGRESSCFTKGDTVTMFAWPGFVVAPFVCYDLRFPEIWRHAVRRGATLMTDIANWPHARIHHWTALLTARAIENQCYVIGVNRAGRDPTLRYPGKSIVIDPSGKVLAEAGEGEQVLTAEIEPAVVEEYRRKLPFLTDIRDEFVPR